MKRRDHGRQFRWAEVDHLVPIRIVSQTGHQYLKLSQAISAVFAAAPSRQVGVRWVSAFVWLLNETFQKQPFVAELIEGSVAQCRTAVDAFVSAVGGIVKWHKRGFDRRWITPDAERHVLVSDALIALGKVTALLAATHYGGQDPMLVDPHERALILAHPDQGDPQKTDSLRRVRVGGNIQVAPRFEDPRISDKWLAMAGIRKVSEAIRWLARWACGSGPRSSSLLPLTMLDYVKSNDIRQVKAIAKGGVSITLVMPRDEASAFAVYVEAHLRRHHGLSIEQCRALARTKRGQSRLAKIPLFSEDGLHHIKYERLARIFRQVSIAAGLTYLSYRGVRRPVTFHHLRHEYVFRRLEALLGIREDEYEARCRRLRSYMGWSKKSTMLEWYSHHFESIFAVIHARETKLKTPVKPIDGAPFTPAKRVSALRLAVGGL